MDEQTRDLLALFNQAGGTGIDPADMDAARAGYAALFTELGGEPVSGVGVETLALTLPGRSLAGRLFRPGGAAAGALPLILFFHGGGWSMGGGACYDAPLSRLAAASGCLVLGVDFRLAPEHKFPAAVADALESVRWAGAAAVGLGGDPGRLAVCGDSAGGTLAAVAAQRLPQQVRAQILLYPVLTLEPAPDLDSRRRLGNGEYFLSRDGIAWAAGNYLADPAQGLDPGASPLLAPDLAGLPPALVVTAGYDPLRDEGEAYATRLRAGGGMADLWCVEETIHGFLSFTGRLEVAEATWNRIGAWVRSALQAAARHQAGPIRP